MDPAELFKQEKYAECLSKCESDLRFATSAQTKFALNLLGSQAALKRNELDKAVSMAEMAIKLDDSKMNAWQAMGDAWRAKNEHGKLGDALTKQMTIAMKNKKPDRAFLFAKEAARAFGRAEKWAESVSRWRDAEELRNTVEGSSEDYECLEGMAEGYDKLGNIAETERIYWHLCEQRKDAVLAVRLLSRPCHVLLEAKRTQQGQPNEINGSWGELDHRVKRLSSIFDPSLPLLFFTRAMVREVTIDDEETFSDEDITLAASAIANEEVHEAFKARAWFILSRKALSDGDSVAAWSANGRGEQLEQIVYAKSASIAQSSSGDRGVVMIGAPTTIQARPFTGNEVYSLVCSRTALTHLAAGRAALTNLTDGVQSARRMTQRHSRDGLLWVQKSMISTPMRENALTQLAQEADWIAALCNCTRGTVALPTPEMNSAGSSWYERRLATLRELVTNVVESESTGALNSRTDLPNLTISKCNLVRRLLVDTSAIELEANRSEQRISDLFNVWMQRLEFVQFNRKLTNAFDPKKLQHIVENDPDAYPLAYEILGRFFMGYDTPFDVFPDEQPSAKQVRDPAAAVRCFQKALALDPLGLGAAAPLANAFHAAKKESQAALLYQGLLDQLSSSSDSHPGNRIIASWAWTRLGQQQLHHDKYPNAATSFQRALGALSRADLSRNVVAWSGLGEAHMRMGRLGAAAQAFEKAIAVLDEDSSDGQENLTCACLIKLATVCTKLGQSSKATEPLRRVLKSRTCDRELVEIAEIDLAESFLEQGRFLRVRGAQAEARLRYKESLALFESYVGRNPASAQGLKGLGDVYDELGNVEGARMAYVKVCHLEPWESLARYDLARHLLVCNEADRALTIRACEAAGVLDPTDSNAWNMLGIARKTTDVLVTQHCLVRSLQLDSQNASSPWLNLGWTFLFANRAGLARRAFSQAQTIEADSSFAWIGHAKLAEKENKAGLPALECAVDAAQYGAEPCALDAMILLGQAICEESSSSFAFQFPAKKQELAKRLLDVSARAVQLAETSKSTKPQHAVAWSMTGIALVALSVSYQAVAAFERSAELFLECGPEFTENADRVLVNLASISDPEVGMSLCQMAAERSPKLRDTCEFHLSMGDLAMWNGEPLRARESYRRALELCSLAPAPSTFEQLRKQSLKLRLIHTYGDDNETDGLMLAKEICDESKVLLSSGSMEMLRDVACAGPTFRLMVQENVMPYPPLSLNREEGEDATRAIAKICFDSPKVHPALFPWMSEAWTETNSAAAAVATLKLCEREPPSRIDVIFEAGLKLIRAIGQGIPPDVPIENCYWTSHGRELKLKYLCPWEYDHNNFE